MAFSFFGYMKVTLPMEALAEHGAWVAFLSPGFARTMGVFEIACALAISPLIGCRHGVIVRTGAILLLVNQAAAIATHVYLGQAGALWLNGLWCVLAVSIFLISRVLADPTSPTAR